MCFFSEILRMFEVIFASEYFLSNEMVVVVVCQRKVQPCFICDECDIDKAINNLQRFFVKFECMTLLNATAHHFTVFRMVNIGKREKCAQVVTMATDSKCTSWSKLSRVLHEQRKKEFPGFRCTSVCVIRMQ